MCIWPIVDVIGLSCLEQKKNGRVEREPRRQTTAWQIIKKSSKKRLQAVYWHSRFHSGLPPASLMLTRNLKWLSWASKISIYGCMRMPKMFVSFVPVFTCFPYCGVIFFFRGAFSPRHTNCFCNTGSWLRRAEARWKHPSSWLIHMHFVWWRRLVDMIWVPLKALLSTERDIISRRGRAQQHSSLRFLSRRCFMSSAIGFITKANGWMDARSLCVVFRAGREERR